MYIVIFTYGVEHYQQDRKVFHDAQEANIYYNKCLNKCVTGEAISVDIYQKLKGYTIFSG
jgi:hypothetical protein